MACEEVREATASSNLESSLLILCHGLTAMSFLIRKKKISAPLASSVFKGTMGQDV